MLFFICGLKFILGITLHQTLHLTERKENEIKKNEKYEIVYLAFDVIQSLLIYNTNYKEEVYS